MRRLGLLLLLLPACGGGSSGPRPQFVDVTQAVGLTFDPGIGPVFPQAIGIRLQIQQRITGTGVAVGDYDGDGDLDLYLLAQTGFPNRLLRNDLDQGLRQFTDVTPPALADLGLSRVAHFADLDNDGDLDLLLVNDDDGDAATPPSRVYRNDGGGAFTDVTATSGFRPIGYLHAGAALADYDGDGLLDVYVTTWAAEGGTGNPGFAGENHLYRNLGGLLFQDVTAEQGLDGFEHDSFTAIFKDFDGDHLPDLYLAVDHTSDQFWFNGGGSFLNATLATGVTHTGNDMGVAPADFDDDGDLDLYVTNITDPTGLNGTTQFNVLYLNQYAATGQVTFFDEALARGAEDTKWGWGVEWVDVENDGDLDLVAVNGYDEWVLTFLGTTSPVYGTPPYLLLNDGTGHFTRRLGAGLDDPSDDRALVAFDYDRDGDLDLVINGHGHPARLFENRSTGAGHWLEVVLAPDSKAVGATVYATTGTKTRRRDVIAGRSFLAGTPSEVHFGLGAAAFVDTLTVEWADGTQQTFTNVSADQVLRLTAP